MLLRWDQVHALVCHLNRWLWNGTIDHEEKPHPADWAGAEEWLEEVRPIPAQSGEASRWSSNSLWLEWKRKGYCLESGLLPTEGGVDRYQRGLGLCILQCGHDCEHEFTPVEDLTLVVRRAT